MTSNTHRYFSRISQLVTSIATTLTASLLLAACGAAPTPPAVFPTPLAVSAGGLASVVNQGVVIYDNSGNEIGNGTVSLYAPSSMKYSDAAKIRLEIAGVGAEGTPVISNQTATPMVSTLLSIHEIMGATLQGVDTAHFTINTIPQNGLRNVDPKQVTWWEWNIRPVGPEAAGTNYLQLLVYYPRTDASGQPFNEEIANFAVNIEVIGPPKPTPTPPPSALEQFANGLSPLVKIAGAITAMAGAAGVLFGAYRALTARSGKKEGDSKKKSGGKKS